MSKEWDIPEGDKVCINCRYLICLGDCGINRPNCINYSTKGTVNHFVPDEDYLRMEIGCKACGHLDTQVCCECSRAYDDLWERGEE